MYTKVITPAYSLREQFLIFLFEISKSPYRFVFKHHATAWKVTRSQLANYPQQTLGNDLYHFLKEHDFEVEPKLESHDVGHVLLQYDTDVVSEICMQFCYLGSGKKSIYSLLTSILAIAILPEHLSLYWTAYKRGKKMLNFQDWDFEHLLREKTNTLRNIIQKKQQENTLIV